jgi:spermidine/putrescine transport system permease protein
VSTASRRSSSSRSGYLLLLPGTVWLLLFFIVPLVSLVSTSLYDPAGTLATGYQLTFAFGNYLDAINENAAEFGRSLLYGGLATVFALLLGYPLAYAIAFKAGRWKSLMLVLVIAPFFTSFLIRTLSWKMLLSDQGVIVDVLQFLQVLGPDGRLLATAPAVVLGLTYNFLPFMVLPLFASLDKIDVRLIEAAGDLYAGPFQGLPPGDAPAVDAGRGGGHAADIHPRAGDYINVELLGRRSRR